MHNTHDTIKDAILEKVQKEHIAPKSPWYFRARHAVLWTPGIAVTLLGSFAVAGMLFGAVHAGWKYRSLTQMNIIQFLGEVVPLLWVGSLAVFGVLIVKTLRLTAKGYRYKTGMILGVSFLSSIVGGAALFALDMTVQHNALIRFETERNQKALWMAPEKGRLTGTIEIFEDGTVVLADAQGDRWVLDTSELPPMPEPLLDGVPVRMLGIPLADSLFLPCKIIPWNLSPFRRPPGALPEGVIRPPRLEQQEKVTRCQALLEATRPSRERNIRQPS